MTPDLMAIPSDEALPGAVDVVVVGAGIVGACAAYYLARRGLKVAIIEKGVVGGEQSSRTWGWCRQQNRDRREMPMVQQSMRLWEAMPGEIGMDPGFRRTGLVYATDDAKSLAAWEAWMDVARDFDVETYMLTGAQAAERIPASRRQWLGGLHSVQDGKAEPSRAAPMLALSARALGATIHQGCAAHGLDVTNGRVTGVVTERGTIRADAVLVAAGAWASRFLRPHGVVFPQAAVRQTALRTKPTANVGEVLYSPDFAMTRRLDGSYTLAISGRATLEMTPQGIRFAREFLPQFIQRLKAVNMQVGKSFLSGPESLGALLTNNPAVFHDHRSLDPAPQEALVAEMVRNVRETFPQLANVEIDHKWGAFVDCTPDSIPVISGADALAGIYIAAGCSGHGFGLGPGIAHLAAELVTNDAPSIDPHPFRLSRLTDGSKIEVGAL